MLDVPVVVKRVEAVNCEGDLSLGAGRPVASRDLGAWRQVLKGMGRLRGVYFSTARARVCVARQLCFFSLDALFSLVALGKGCGARGADFSSRTASSSRCVFCPPMLPLPYSLQPTAYATSHIRLLGK
jgi:hypothetical protein